MGSVLHEPDIRHPLRPLVRLQETDIQRPALETAPVIAHAYLDALRACDPELFCVSFALMLDALEALRKESAVIKAAPGSVLMIVTVTACVVVAGSAAWFSRELALTRQTVNGLQQERDFYKTCVETGALTPACAKVGKVPPATPSAPASPSPTPPAAASPAAEGKKPTPYSSEGQKAQSPKSSSKPRAPATTTVTTATTPAVRDPDGVLYLDTTKLRLTLASATRATQCVGYSCYRYAIYIGGQVISVADSIQIKVYTGETYEFRIVISPAVMHIVPTFENSCSGEFEITDRASWLEFNVQIEPLNPQSGTYRLRECNLTPQ